MVDSVELSHILLTKQLPWPALNSGHAVEIGKQQPDVLQCFVVECNFQADNPETCNVQAEFKRFLIDIDSFVLL